MNYEGNDYAVKITAKEFKEAGNTVYDIQTMNVMPIKNAPAGTFIPTGGARSTTSEEAPTGIVTFGELKEIFNFPNGHSQYTKISVVGDNVSQQSDNASDTVKRNPTLAALRDVGPLCQISCFSCFWWTKMFLAIRDVVGGRRLAGKPSGYWGPTPGRGQALAIRPGARPGPTTKILPFVTDSEAVDMLSPVQRSILRGRHGVDALETTAKICFVVIAAMPRDFLQ